MKVSHGLKMSNEISGSSGKKGKFNYKARMGKLNLKKELPITTTLFPFVMLNLFQHLCSI